jgi:hypothetical protein
MVIESEREKMTEEIPHGEALTATDCSIFVSELLPVSHNFGSDACTGTVANPFPDTIGEFLSDR